MIKNFFLFLAFLICLEITVAGCIKISKRSDVTYEFPCKAVDLMLKYFLILKLYFINVFDINNPQSLSIDDLRAYGNKIQLCGKLTMLILDELRNNYDFRHYEHVMVINLYLNNTTEIEIMYKKPGMNKYSPKIDINKIKRMLIDLQMGQNTVEKNLMILNENMCSHHADDDSDKKSMKNRMLRIKKRLSFNGKKIYIIKTRLARYHRKIHKLVKKKENDYRYLDFHPINLLFFKVLSGNKINDSVINSLKTQGNEYYYINVPYETSHETLRSLNLIRNIKILNNSEISITLEKFLSDYMVFNYNSAIMNEFHQMVFAATIQPLYVVLETYYYMISIATSKKDEKNNFVKYLTTICETGSTLNKYLEQFIQLNILPSNMYNDLNDIMKQSNIIVNEMKSKKVALNISKKLENLKTKITKITKVMEINSIDYKIPLKDYVRENMFNLIKVIENVNDQVAKLVHYVETLKRYTKAYKTVLRVIPPSFDADNRVPVNIIDYYQTSKLLSQFD